MSRFARPCPTCGARIPPGGVCPRCGDHRRSSSCRECGARTNGGPYCRLHEHRAEVERVARQPWRMAYRDPSYHKHRAQRYKAAEGRCEACGIAVAKGEFECDHVVPLSRGGTNAVENLRILCVNCHSQKTQHDGRRRRGEV